MSVRFYFKTFCLPVACFWITVKMFQFFNWSNNNLGYVLRFLKAYTGVAITSMIHGNNSSSWSTLFWSVEHSHKVCISNSYASETVGDVILWSAKIGRCARCSTDRRDRHIKSLITGMSVCISGLRCRDSEFHFGRLLRAGTHYLRHFLQSPS